MKCFIRYYGKTSNKWKKSFGCKSMLTRPKKVGKLWKEKKLIQYLCKSYIIDKPLGFNNNANGIKFEACNDITKEDFQNRMLSDEDE